jgi:hypothetical protein
MSAPLAHQACELVGRDARRAAGVLDVLAERLARHVDAGEQLVAGLLPGGDAALQTRDVGVAGGARILAARSARPSSSSHSTMRVVAARHETREIQLQPAQRDRARPQQMALREKISSSRRSISASSPPSDEHGFDGERIERSHRLRHRTMPRLTSAGLARGIP